MDEVSSCAAIRTCIKHHYSILTSILYRVQTLTSHNTEESEYNLESLHRGEIKRTVRKREVKFTTRSMLRYVILLNIHEGIGLQVRRCVLLYFDLDC